MLPVIEGKLLSPFQVHIDRATVGIAPRTASRLLDRQPFRRSRLAYRDVAGATNKLTLIAGLLPPGTVSTHTIFVSKTPLDPPSQWCLLGLMNSLVANYLVRLRVMTHVTVSLMGRLPVPRPPAASRAFEMLATLSQRLAQTGIGTGANDYAQLNAIAAQLYGLSRDQFIYLLATFPLIAADVRERCVKAFDDGGAIT